MKPIKTRITLFDNYNGYDFDEFKAFLEEFNDNVTDRMVYEAIGNSEMLDWREMLSVLSDCECDNNCDWIIRGGVQRWNGRMEGWTVYNSAEIMLQKFGKDCDYFKIEIVDGNLEIECSHHDGTNSATARLLTRQGVSEYDDWENDYGEHADYSQEQMLELLWENHTQKIDIDL